MMAAVITTVVVTTVATTGAAVKAMALVITLDTTVTTNGAVMKNVLFGCHQIQDNNRLAAIVNNSIFSSRNVNYGSCRFIK